MAILIVGSTGQIGSQILPHLTNNGLDVRALSRSPAIRTFPEGIKSVKGDLLEPDSIRQALKGVTTLFLLNSVSEDELTKGLIAVNLAKEAGIRSIVYFSMLNSDTFSDTPHAAAKYTIERAIHDVGISATILRPNYFFQNDAMQKKALLKNGTYPNPIGEIGVSMVDTRDIAQIAAQAIIEREQSITSLPNEIIEIVGPEEFTGTGIAKVWSALIGKPVKYEGDLLTYEEVGKAVVPKWMAYDNALMFRGFQKFGMRSKASTAKMLETRLGRRLHSYEDFAKETLSAWNHPVSEAMNKILHRDNHPHLDRTGS
jgi:uncharacterized protein YbjT (DUF2867 family)